MGTKIEIHNFEWLIDEIDGFIEELKMKIRDLKRKQEMLKQINGGISE